MNQMNSDALVERTEAYLEHYGIRGMKWGQWNSETRARYLGLGRKLGSAVSKKVGQAGDAATRGAALAKKHAAVAAVNAKNAAKAKVSEAKEARKAKRQQKDEIEAQRKELGMTKAKYEKLREQTLKSHDPRIVEKGMHTLTDDELNTKISRLQKEETISKMANAKETRKHQENQARNQAIASNPLVKLGTGLAEKKMKQVLGLDKKGKDDKGDKGDKGDNGDKNGNESKSTGKSSKSTQDSPVKVSNPNFYKQVVNSPTTMSSALRGQKYLSGGFGDSVMAQVVSVETVNGKKK